MKKGYHLFVFLASALAISGCVSTRAMPKEILDSKTSCDTTLFIIQNNLRIIVPQTDPGNTGLVGALVASGIDAAREEAAAKAAAPLFKALEGHDFKTTMRDALVAELQSITTISASPDISIQTISTDSQKELSYRDSQAESVLFVEVWYNLQGTTLSINALVDFFGKSERLRALQRDEEAKPPLGTGSRIYYNSFGFSYQGINADNIVIALEEGAKNIAKQISVDIMNTK